MKGKKSFKAFLVGLFTLFSCSALLVGCGGTGFSSSPICPHVWGEWVATDAPTCEEGGVESRTCVMCKGTETRDVSALGHAWATPTFTWTESADGYDVVVSTVCATDETHVRSEEARVERETTEATCYEDGSVVYTASVTWDEVEYTDEKTVVLPIVHHYGEYLSSAEGHWQECECGATTDVVEHAPATPVTENIVGVTCGGAGSYDEVVYCSDCGYEMSRENKIVDAIPHTYGEPEFTWTETADGYTVTALFTCTVDASHTASETCTVTSQTTEATCYEEGETVYTANLVFENRTFADEKTVVLPIVHHYGEYLSSAEGHWTACECGATTDVIEHTPATPVTENVVGVTCGGAGSYDEVVYCSVCEYEISRENKTVEAIPHVYGAPVFTWTETADGYTVTVLFTCTADESHTATQECDVEFVKTDYTCEADGSIVYTAKVVFENKTYTDGKTIVLPTVHEYTIPKKDETGHWNECTCGAKDEIVAHEGAVAKVENEVAPTCGEEGSYDEVVYCKDCEYEMSRTQKTVAKLPHTYGEPTFAWTESENGYTVTATFVCTVDETHVVSETCTVTSQTTEATCYEEGEIVYTANLVFENATYTDGKTVVLPIVHEYTDEWHSDETGHWNECTCGAKNEIVAHEGKAAKEENRVEPTCGEEGSYDEVVYCKDCEYEMGRVSKGIPTLPHEYGEPTFTWTETANGYKATATFVCTNDASHTATQECAVEFVKTDYTCTEDGSIVYTASVVLNEISYEDSKTVVLKAACRFDEEYLSSADGHWKKCTVCGEVTATVAHESAEGVKENEVKATCGAAGSYDVVVYCSVCEYEMSRVAETVPATGEHEAGEPVKENYVPSTCTQKGTYDLVTYCVGCGVEMIKAVCEEDLKDHDCDETILVQGSCTETGKKKRECKDCDFEEEVSVPAKGHNYVNRICTECGLVKESEGLNFTTSGNSAILSGMGSCQDTLVSIPAFVDGIPVTAIAANAFENNTNIVELYFSDLVTTISERAFYGCTNLRKVVFSNSLTIIGDYAFTNCSSLQEVILPNSVKTVGRSAFSSATALTKVVIGEEVTSLGEYAFYRSVNLTYVEFNAIACADYGTVSSSSRPNYFTNSGSKSGGFAIVVGDKVTRIPRFMFAHGSSVWSEDEVNAMTLIKSVVLPESGTLKEIGEYAFSARYKGVVGIFVPKSVTKVGANAFQTRVGWSYVGGDMNGQEFLFDCDLIVMFESPTKNYGDWWNEDAYISSKLTNSNHTGTYYGHYINYAVNATKIFGVTQDGYQWVLLQDGTIAIVGVDPNLTVANIPSVIDGKTVTVIGTGAMQEHWNLTKVIVPQTIKELGRSCFGWCPKLQEVEYYATDAKADSSLFSILTAEQGLNITVGANVKSLPNNVFRYDAQNVTSSLVFEQGSVLESIGQYAIGLKLDYLVLPSSLKTIENYAFYSINTSKYFYEGTAEDFDKIEIGTNNTRLTGRAIYWYTDEVPEYEGYFWNYQDGVPTILEFTPTGDNKVSTKLSYAISSDGTYYTLTGIGQCTDTEVIVPAIFNGKPVRAIASNAFKGNANLTKFSLPAGITLIEGYAFEGTGYYNDESNWEDGVLYIDDYLIIAKQGDAMPETYSVREGTTLIAKSAFYKAGVVNLTLPETLKHINGSAFYYCTALKTIYIPDTLETLGTGAFATCTSLTGTIKVPEGTTILGVSAFENCYKLEHVILPSTITKIDSYAFRNCYKLQELNLPYGLTHFGNDVFDNCYSIKSITIPSSVYNNSFNTGIFEGWYSLEEMVVPFIGSGVGTEYNFTSYSNVLGRLFEGMSYSVPTGYPKTVSVQQKYGSGTKYYYMPANLRKITITNERYLAAGTFYNCDFLEEIILPEGLIEIGANAFYGASGISTITIPSTVTRIRDSAFYGCISLFEVQNLSSLEIVEGSTSHGYVGYYAANVYGAGETSKRGETADGFMYVAGESKVILTGYKGEATEIVLPETIDGRAYYVGDGAFRGRTDLTKVTISSGVLSIGSYAFYGCTNLTGTITIPATQTEVYPYTFYDCTSLEKVVLHDDITKFGIYAFRGCESFTEITIPKSLVSMGAYAVQACYNVQTVYMNATAANELYSGHYVFGGLGKNAQDGVKVIVAEGVTVIPGYFFYNVPVSEICFAENGALETIGYHAFEGSSLKTVVVPDGVKKVESYAFYKIATLTKAVFPASVEVMGNSSLGGCSTLEELVLPFVGYDKESTGEYGLFGYIFGTTSVSGINYTNQYYGTGSSNTRKYYIPETIQKVTVLGGQIRYGAFSNCNFIKQIVLPEDLTAIGAYAFRSMGALEDFVVPETVETVDQYAFAYARITEITIPESVTTVGQYAFYDSYLTTLTLKGTPVFGRYAFSGCKYLTEVTFTGTMEEWLSLEFTDSFSNPLYYGASFVCDGSVVNEVVIPESVTVIKPYAFVGASGVSAVKLHAGVTQIGSNAFYRCQKLIEVYNASTLDIALGAETHGYVAYYATYLYDSLDAVSPLIRTADGFVFSHNEDTGVYSLVDYTGGKKEITLPSNIEGDTYEVASYAFYGVPVTSVTVTEGAVKMCERAFYYCDTLKKVEFGKCVEFIGAECFYGCGPEEMVLPFIGETMKTPTDTYQRPIGYIFAHTQPESDCMYYYDYGQQPHFQGSTSEKKHAGYHMPTTVKKLTVLGGHLLQNALSEFNSSYELILGDDVQSVQPYSCYYSITSNYSERGVTKLHIGDSITALAHESFTAQPQLTEVTGGKNLKTLGDKCFNSCYALEKVNLEGSLDRVGWAVFYCCYALREFTSDGVVQIDKNAFNEAALTSFDFSKTEIIGEYAFEECELLEEVVIGVNSDVVLGQYAFSACPALKKVTIGDCVVSPIPGHAFYYNEALERVIIGNGVTEIGQRAFYYCRALSLVVLGRSVTTVASETFLETGISTVYNLSNLSIVEFSDVGYIGYHHPTIYTSLDEGPLVEEQ